MIHTKTKLVVLAMCIGASVVSAQHQRYKTLSPSQPTDSWPIPLQPDESAYYSINIVDSASYVLAQSSFFKNFNNPDFIWSGGGGGRNFSFSIMNTSWKAGIAIAHMDCAWRPVGGPGSGSPPPWIYGWAHGEATALPADFAVEVRYPIPAIAPIGGVCEMESVLKKNEWQKKDANANWSIAHPAYFEGPYQNVSVVQATSDQAGSYFATATCVDCGKSAGATARFVEVNYLEYHLGNYNWSAPPVPIYTPVGSNVYFRAIPNPTPDWPTGKPVWGGAASGTGTDQVSVFFPEPGSNDITAECGNTVTSTVVAVKAELEIYKPKVIDPAEPMIPEEDRLAVGGITFVNLDNDDGGTKFDNDPAKTEVVGGDNELVKVRLKLQPNDLDQGEVRLLAPEGAGSIAVWTNNTKSLSAAYDLGTVLNVPADFTVEGDSLVKTLWIEGTAAHTVQRQTRLKMEYTVDGLTCDDEASLTVVGVKSVNWIGIGNSVNNDDNLTECSNWPSGLAAGSLRVFPGARSDGQGNIGDARDKVKVEVELSVAPPHEIKMYLKSFDVDDPAAHDNAVDTDGPNGQPNDNRGTIPDPAGMFVGESGGVKELVFPAGVKTTNCLFQVTMQPGDNFRVVANGDKDFLLSLESDDTKQDDGSTIEERNENKQRICHGDVAGTSVEREVREADKYVSPTLTVWRFLHIEVDSMAAPGPTDNIVTGQLTGISGSGTIATQMYINVNLRTDLDPEDHSANLTAGTGNGRFENGWMWIGTGEAETYIDDILGNGDMFVRGKAAGIDIPALMGMTNLPDVGGNVIAWSDTSFTLNVTSGTLSTNYIGGVLNVAGVESTVSGVSTNGGTNIVIVTIAPNIPFSLYDDDSPQGTTIPVPDTSRLEPAFEPAYVVTLENVLPGGGDILPFIANIQDTDANAIANGWKFNNKNHRSPMFWVVYVRGAYQSDTDEYDGDPDSEYVCFGIANVQFGPSGATSEGGVNIYQEGFVESVGWDRPNLPGRGYRADDVVIHEVGHLFNCQHTDGGVMGDDNPDPSWGAPFDSIDFSPISLDQIRQRDYP